MLTSSRHALGETITTRLDLFHNEVVRAKDAEGPHFSDSWALCTLLDELLHISQAYLTFYAQSSSKQISTNFQDLKKNYFKFITN